MGQLPAGEIVLKKKKGRKGLAQVLAALSARALAQLIRLKYS